MFPSRRHWCPLLLPCAPLSLALIACAEGASPPPATAVARDSAGIRIVDSTVPQWHADSAWRLSARPVMQLGAGLEGDPNQQFANLRAVRRLADGTLMVADAGTFALSWFDMDGSLLRRSGGRGEGPGEMGAGLMREVLTCPDDSIFVSGRGRVTVFGPDGAFERTFDISPQPTPFSVPRFCIGSRIVATLPGNDWRSEPGLYRDSVAIAVYGADGAFLAVVDTIPVEDRTYARSAAGIGYHATPFGRTLSMAASGPLIAMGMGDVFEVAYRDSSGAVVRIARVVEPGRTIARSDVERYRDFVLDGFMGNPQELRTVENELSGTELPATFPAFAELVFDVGGNLWVRRYDFFDAIRFYNYAPVPGSRDIRVRLVPDTPRTWSVLDSTGVWLGDVETPAGLIVHQIGHDWLLGIWRDEVDVEHVQLYEIVGPGSR